jgi:hypothetical protein
MAIAGLKNLCTPSYVYLVVSIIFILVALFQNYNYSDTYCLGSYSCSVPSTMMIFIIKILYVLFWTWVLNLICKAGAPTFAWILVLFPIILMFLLIVMYMIANNVR